MLREAEAADPMSPSLLRSLAELYFGESEFLTESGCLPQAAKCLENALTRFEKLAKIDSGVKERLGKCYMNLASIQAELGAFQKAEEAGDQDLCTTVREEIALLRRCEAAPDSLAENIDLFPLPGVTPGLSGLLVAMPQWTIMVASDAVPTIEHLEAGQVLQNCSDIQAAQESLREVVEIADLLIPGRDGLIPNPLRKW